MSIPSTSNIILSILCSLVVAMFGLMFYDIYDSEMNYETDSKVVKYVIINKEAEQVSINRFGDFRTEYYLLLNDGSLKNIELKEYMSLSIGDTVSYMEYYEHRKND